MSKLGRRALLESTAAAIAAAPFARIASAREGEPWSGMKGIWWFQPSFLEHPEGPWGVCKDRTESPLALWKACLSWLADHGLDSAFVHFGPFGGDLSPFANDRVRTGWGFHYLLEFDRFPEARTFDRATLARNRELLNAICEHGKAVGCRVYTHHYNFSAPKPFVDANREKLLAVEVGSRRERKTLYPGFCDQRQILHRNLCWNSDLYRAFMISCWKETCREIPDLAGILVTPGENARCPCVRCVGPTDDPSAPFSTSRERLSTLGHFARTFTDTMLAERRSPLIRAWAAGKSRPWREVFPKEATIFLKYSFFDVVDSPADPAIAEWAAGGHRVVATPEIQGGENGGPQLWRRPGYLPEVVANTIRAGASGIVACVNSEHGFLSTPRRVQHAPTLLFAHAAAGDGRDSDEPISREHDRSIFGAAGDAIHDGLVAASEVMFLLPRIVFEPEEGYTWQFSYHFFEDSWPGGLGLTIDAEDWIAGDLAGLKALFAAARSKPYTDPFTAEALGGRSDPIARLAAVRDRAVDGERAVLAAASRVADSAQEEFALVRTSVRLAVLQAEEWLGFLRAKLCFEAVSGPNDEATRSALAARCLKEFDAAIGALEETIAVASTLPVGIVGDGLVKRVPQKVAARRKERDEAARRLGSPELGPGSDPPKPSGRGG